MSDNSSDASQNQSDNKTQNKSVPSTESQQATEPNEDTEQPETDEESQTEDSVVSSIKENIEGVVGAATEASGKVREFVKMDSDREVSGVYTSSRIDKIAYSIFGRLFRDKESSYKQFSLRLEQAQYPVSYDVYLSRVFLYTVISAVLSVLLGVTASLFAAPIIAAVDFGVSVPPEIANIIIEYEILLVSIAITFVFLLLVVGVTIVYLYYKPIYTANERGRKIDSLLPHSVIFLYAMSRGGVNILEIFRSLAEAEDTYGEVSKEFQAIVNNVEYIQTDLQTAVLERAQKTPSDELRVFLEDFLNVIESGSDIESFFLNKSETELESLRNEHNRKLEQIELLSQVYVIAFVAGPIFIVVVLMVMSMVQEPKTTLLYVITYVGLPLASGAFVLVIELISGDVEAGTEQVQRLSQLSYGERVEKIKNGIEEGSSGERYKQYKSEMARQSIVSRIIMPFKSMKTDPKYTLVVTVPGLLAYIGVLFSLDLIELQHQFFINNAYWSSTAAGLVPIIILFAPMSYIYETNARAKRSVLKELPDAFKSVREANSRGLTLQESFRIVAEDSNTHLSKGLQRSLRQAEWSSINFALISFANELRVPRLTRNVRLITQANQISGNVQSVLSVAVKDVENMHKIDKRRKSNAYSHLATIILSFGIALFVISVMDAAFMQQIAEFGQGGGNLQQSGGSGGGGIGGGFGSLPVDEFRMLFLHITMVLAVTAGISGGIIARGSFYSGLKFVVVGVAVSISVYLVMPTVVDAAIL